MTRGQLVVLEGLDGAGTTTQCAALAAALRGQGREVVTTCEPSDGPVGTLIRQALKGRLALPHGLGGLTPTTLALLFAADRADHLAATIEPSLKRGALVLSDRYLLSSLAYQGAQVGMKWVQALNRHARTPDLTLFLTLHPKVAAQRRASRGGSEELYEAQATQVRTARQYRLAIAARRKAKERVVELDGAQTPAQVTAQALAEIAALSRAGRR